MIYKVIGFKKMSCGFCLCDAAAENQFWKCDQCSWEGHPSCWLMLRGEALQQKYITHVPDTKSLNPWLLPKGRCPQCRIEISWEQFIQKNRQMLVPTPYCWICQEENPEVICECGLRHHSKCMEKWTFHGFCSPECLCSRHFLPSNVKIIQEWQNEIQMLSKTVSHSSFYELFFQDTSQGRMKIHETQLLLEKYHHFLLCSVMKNPIKWWRTMHFTTSFLFEQLKLIQSYLLTVELPWAFEDFLVQYRNDFLKWIDLLQESKIQFDREHPNYVKIRSYYQENRKFNRISPPLPGEFFPVKWFMEYQKMGKEISKK
jgi:hypothetical protein